MDDAKELATQILSAIGCRVEEIPETDDERADLVATDAMSTYLVEVKHKFDDPEVYRNQAERLARGEVVSRAALITHNNRIGAILKKGCQQLDKTPGLADAFRLIWFHADGIDHDLHWNRAFATFYGHVYLLAKDPPGKNVVQCFYFDYSAAWSLPSIDAMILSDNQGLQLCLNEFSDRIDYFYHTALCQRFAKDEAVVDPRKLIANSHTIFCRSDVPRKNDDDVLNALREKTGILYTAIRFSQHSASAMVNSKYMT